MAAMAEREAAERPSTRPGAGGIAAGCCCCCCRRGGGEEEEVVIAAEVENAGAEEAEAAAAEAAEAEAAAAAGAPGSTPVNTGAGAVLGATPVVIVAGGGATAPTTRPTPGSASLGAANPPGMPRAPPPVLGAWRPAREATPTGLTCSTLMGSGASSSARETPTRDRGGAAEEAVGTAGAAGTAAAAAVAGGDGETGRAAAPKPKPKPASPFGVAAPVAVAGAASATGTAAKLPSPTGIRARVVDGPAGRTATAFESLGAADEDATAVTVVGCGGGGGGGGGGGAGAAGGLPSITVPRSLVPSQAELICALASAASDRIASDARRRGWIVFRPSLLRRRGVELAASTRRRAGGDAPSLFASLPLDPAEQLRSLRYSGIYFACFCFLGANWPCKGKRGERAGAWLFEAENRLY